MLNTSLIMFGGGSPCALGIQTACPYYVDPIWYKTLAVVGIIGIILAITLTITYLIFKRRRTPIKKIALYALIIILIVFTINAAYVIVKKVRGNAEWDANIRQYKECLQNVKGLSCEY